MNIRFASLTDVGVKRSHNQDACACQPAPDAAVFAAQGSVFVVADGMGGHAVGEKASAKAVRDIPLTFLKHVQQEGVSSAVRRAFTEANAAIHAIGQNNPEFKGLGTTGTALFVRPDGAWLGHVGDSRAYRIRGGHVQQLTFDHSWVWEVARRQGIDPDELGDFKRNVIIRSLGPDADVEVDVEGPHPVLPGDVFLMCSDGLSNVVTADEFGAVATTFPPDEACKYLVALANVRGGPDNITSLIVAVDGSAAEATTTGSKLRRIAVAVNRLVPWPFLALAGGAATAGASVALRSEGLPGAPLAFVLAAGLILGGLVGLYLHLRRRDDEAAERAENEPGEPNVYRDHPFEIGPPLVDRFADLDARMREVVGSKDLGIDLSAHEKYVADAAEAAKRADWPAAFRARFLAVQVLAVGVNKLRQKDEVFQPNWSKPPRVLGG